MAVSPSGLGTLLALIFIGPIIYLARYLYRKSRGLRDQDDTPADTEGAAGEEEGREELKSSEFLFALVGYAIGIGNVWRFPYVIAQNGGAAALFAYIVCAIFVAVSCPYLEISFECRSPCDIDQGTHALLLVATFHI